MTKTFKVITIALVLIFMTTSVFAFGAKKDASATSSSSSPSVKSLADKITPAKSRNWTPVKLSFYVPSARCLRQMEAPVRITRFAPDWVRIEVDMSSSPNKDEWGSSDIYVTEAKIEHVIIKSATYIEFDADFPSDIGEAFKSADGKTPITYIETY